MKYEGIIDTGFSGFIKLPMDVGIRLSLPLEGAKYGTLADESQIKMLTASADVTVGEETKREPHFYLGLPVLSW